MKSMMRTFGAAFLLMLSLLVWGCSNENGSLAPNNQITDEERDDLADDFASTLAGPQEGMLSFWMSNGSGGVRGPAEGGALDDTLIFDRDGFHVVLVRNYYDVNGVWSPIYDSLTSVRLNRLLWINGTFTNQSGRRTVTIDHFDSTVVWGIDPISDIWTLQGSGERTVNSEFASRFRQNVKTLIATYSWTIHDLVIHKDRTLHPYPLSGDIAVDILLTRTHQNPGRDFEETIDVSLVVYFDGTQWAHVVFSDGREYWIDLEEGWCHRDRP